MPAGFLDDDGPLPALKGTFTVLADGGMNDVEIIRWLHTHDDTLPVAGDPPGRHPRRLQDRGAPPRHGGGLLGHRRGRDGASRNVPARSETFS